MKKYLSVFLGILLFVLSPCCFGTNVNADVNASESADSESTEDSEIAEVIFVPDDEIAVDSIFMSARLGTDKAKRINFVLPDKNGNVLSRELFPNGSPKSEDVKQGALYGGCYFFAVLAALADIQPELLKENLVEDGKGNVTVKFYHPHNGEPFYIKVQKTVPDLPDAYKFVPNDCLWVHMYLKAFVASGFAGVAGYMDGHAAKNYKSSEFGIACLVMRMLTGFDTKIYEPTSSPASKDEIKLLYSKIKESLLSDCPVVCDFTPFRNPVELNRGAVSDRGLVRYHIYSIEKVYKDDNGQKWIKLRNPWGCYVPVYDEYGQRVADFSDKSDGRFVLKFNDFANQRGRVYFGEDREISPKSRNEIFSELKAQISISDYPKLIWFISGAYILLLICAFSMVI